MPALDLIRLTDHRSSAAAYVPPNAIFSIELDMAGKHTIVRYEGPSKMACYAHVTETPDEVRTIQTAALRGMVVRRETPRTHPQLGDEKRWLSPDGAVCKVMVDGLSEDGYVWVIYSGRQTRAAWTLEEWAAPAQAALWGCGLLQVVLEPSATSPAAPANVNAAAPATSPQRTRFAAYANMAAFLHESAKPADEGMVNTSSPLSMTPEEFIAGYNTDCYTPDDGVALCVLEDGTETVFNWSLPLPEGTKTVWWSSK